MVHVVQLADTHYDHGYEAEDEHQRTQQSEKVHGLDAEPGKEPKGKQVQIPVYKTVQPELGLSIFACLVVHHQARKYGKTKFGLNRFVNGYLDLLSLWFLSRFGIKPMHFFGLLGSLMFIFGFIAVVIVGVSKLYYMHHGMPYRLVTDSPYFYLSLTSMIIGTQLFVAGFLGELISRNAPERNKYQIEKTI